MRWRAALAAPGRGRAPRGGRRDALLFRHERYRLFPDAQAEERALELNEGVAEYTGVRVGLPTPPSAPPMPCATSRPSCSRPPSCAPSPMPPGPAWGLLLDQADPAWRDELARRDEGGHPPGLDQMLQAALKLPEPSAATVKAREADYDDTLRPRELARDQARQAHLAELKARLVDGPVLRLPLAGHHASYQFNPQTLEALGSAGRRLSDDEARAPTGACWRWSRAPCWTRR